MKPSALKGLIAATFTPMRADGRVDLARIEPLVAHLVRSGLSGLYVGGSTGEGPSLTTGERKEVAEAFVAAVGGRLPVAVQVGHNSLAEARDLARHAQEIGATKVSATAPAYFKQQPLETLVKCMACIAEGTPDLPFYYYHIPALVDVRIDVPAFLRQVADRIPNSAGLKYTASTVWEY